MISPINIIIGFSIIVIIYGIVAIFVAIYSLTSRRDELYKEKYEAFLEQKERVENRLKRRNDEEE
jgi:hypothetical protein